MAASSVALSIVENSANETIARGYADQLFGLSVPENLRSKANFPVRQNLPVGAHSNIPAIDDGYVFAKEHSLVLQQWFWGSDGATNIMLTGETGTGKTSLINQAAARLCWPVFRVGCHSALEFQELVGRVTLNPDGSTGWVDGPLILAAKMGGILLLDELNMLAAGTAGGLNTALDDGLDSGLSGKDLLASMKDFATGIQSRGAYYVPETGEMVKSHPCFRIAATGNAVDGSSKGKYRGVQTSNMALLDRFTLGIKMGYMSIEDEKKMLQSRFPNIDASILTSLCDAAVGIRESYAAGQLNSVLSTRIMKALTGRIAAGSSNQKEQLNSIGRFLEMSMLYRVEDVDSMAIKLAISSQLKLTLGLREFNL